MGLWHVLCDFAGKGYVEGGWKGLVREVERIARVGKPGQEELGALLQRIPWTSVFTLTERVYGMLTGVVEGEEWVQLDYVQERYGREMNQLLGEEGIGYEFRNGRLCRPGRPSTQNATARAAHVLADPRLSRACTHFRKAQKSFADGPTADYEKTVMEAVMALEATMKALLPGRDDDPFCSAAPRERYDSRKDPSDPDQGDGGCACVPWSSRWRRTWWC